MVPWTMGVQSSSSSSSQVNSKGTRPGTGRGVEGVVDEEDERVPINKSWLLLLMLLISLSLLLDEDP